MKLSFSSCNRRILNHGLRELNGFVRPTRNAYRMLKLNTISYSRHIKIQAPLTYFLLNLQVEKIKTIASFCSGVLLGIAIKIITNKAVNSRTTTGIPGPQYFYHGSSRY